MVNAGSGGSDLTLEDLEDVGWISRFLPSAWPPFTLHALGEESKDVVVEEERYDQFYPSQTSGTVFSIV